jgi:hypothetical protein
MENVLGVRGSISGFDITAGELPLPCSLRPRYALPLLTDFFVVGGIAAGKGRSGWSGFPYHGTQWL